MSDPEITVAALAENDGRFLLVEERIGGRLVLNQPAGHLERGETLLEAVVREAREETAWRFTPEWLLGVYLWRQPRTQRLYKRFAFIGSLSDHRPEQPLDTGIVGTRWLSGGEVRARASELRSPLVLRCIEDYLAGVRAPLDPLARLDLEAAAAVPAQTLCSASS